jgi:hypothetical protein
MERGVALVHVCLGECSRRRGCCENDFLTAGLYWPTAVANMAATTVRRAMGERMVAQRRGFIVVFFCDDHNCQHAQTILLSDCVHAKNGRLCEATQLVALRCWLRACLQPSHSTREGWWTPAIACSCYLTGAKFGHRVLDLWARAELLNCMSCVARSLPADDRQCFTSTD